MEIDLKKQISKYVQIREKLGITRGTMETLTKVIRDNK